MIMIAVRYQEGQHVFGLSWGVRHVPKGGWRVSAFKILIEIMCKLLRQKLQFNFNIFDLILSRTD
jgi:hypothetical protein